MVRTPVQVHLLSTVSMPAKWSEQPFKCTRSALYPCQPSGNNTRSNGKNTRSSALAQHCIHASQMERTPVQVHSLSTVSMPAKWSEHPCKCTRSALYPCQPNGKNTRSSALGQHCQPNGKNTRSSALAQHCILASQMVGTPVEVHSLSIVSMPAKWYEHPFKCTGSALHPCQPNGKNTCSSALAQHCIQVHRMGVNPFQIFD